MKAYRFIWNQPKITRVRTNAKEDTLALGYATANKASQGAPVKSSALVNSIRVTDDQSDTVLVKAGGQFAGKSLPYALRREFENNLHPHKKYYMRNAFNWAKENYQKYYKGVTK